MKKKQHHERSRMSDRYDIDALITALPELKEYVINGPKGLTIDFASAKAVRVLNQALMAYHYRLKYWEIPKSYLIPPIPGRLDYIHHLADFLAKDNKGIIPKGNKLIGLDIGSGSTAIYSVLANLEYGWMMKGSEIDKEALDSSMKILRSNRPLSKYIKLVHQPNSANFFRDVIGKDEHFDFTICNPPYYKDEAEALAANIRKTQNLSKSKSKSVNKNFGGVNTEIVYPGGEKAFLISMIQQSRPFGNNVLWFTALVSSQTLLNVVKSKFADVKTTANEIIDVSHGNKKSRIICWTFLTEAQRKNWIRIKWNS